MRKSSPVPIQALCAVLVLFAAIVSGCRNDSADAPRSSDKLVRISQRNEPADLDPATASLPDEFFVIRALGEGLLLPNPDGGAPLPGLASRFDVSADGLTYTFHLRENLFWSNGQPLAASDLLASYERVLTPATAAPKASLFFAVKNARAFASGALADFSSVGFRAPDPRTFIVTLERSHPRFPLYVATGAWIPVHRPTIAAHGRRWTQPEHHVGNGPFRLVEWRPQQRIVVRKNPLYHNPAAIAADELHFLRFDSGETEERAFRAGQVDITMAVPESKLATYQRERPAELHRRPLAETRFLSFNTQRGPLADSRVRRALSLALPREQLVERVVRGGQTPAHRFLSPALLRDSSAPVDPPAPSSSAPTTNPGRARELLAAAGFPGGRTFPRLEVTAWSPSQLATLETIQAVWKAQLGIDVGLRIREAKVHLASLTSGDYDIAFVTNLLDVADPLAALGDFTSVAPNNFPHWRSKEFDSLLAAAAAEASAERQSALLARAEALLLAEAPIAPLYFNAQNWLMSPRVRGWKQDALWNRTYHDLRLD